MPFFFLIPHLPAMLGLRVTQMRTKLGVFSGTVLFDAGY